MVCAEWRLSQPRCGHMSRNRCAQPCVAQRSDRSARALQFLPGNVTAVPDWLPLRLARG